MILILNLLFFYFQVKFEGVDTAIKIQVGPLNYQKPTEKNEKTGFENSVYNIDAQMAHTVNNYTDTEGNYLASAAEDVTSEINDDEESLVKGNPKSTFCTW